MSTFVWEFLSVVSNESWDSDSSSQRSWAQFSGLTARNHNGTVKNRWKKRQSKTTRKHVEFALSESLWNSLPGLFFYAESLISVAHMKTTVFQSVWKLAQRLIDSLSFSLFLCLFSSPAVSLCCLCNFVLLNDWCCHMTVCFHLSYRRRHSFWCTWTRSNIRFLLHWPMVGKFTGHKSSLLATKLSFTSFLILKLYFLPLGNAIFPLFSPVNVTMWLAASYMRSLQKTSDCVAHIFVLVV